MLEWLPTCSEELIAPLSIITRARSLSLVRALYLITNLKIALLITDTDTIILNNHRRYCSAPFDIRLFDGSALGLCESNLNSITLGHTRNMASRMRKTGTKKAALFAKSTAPALELHDIRSAEKVNFGGFLCLPRGFPDSTSTTGIAPIATLDHMNRFDHVLIGFQLELCTWGPAGCSRRIGCPFLESN